MDYESLRKNYKPNQITALFIAESPPAPKSNRFFYLEGVTKADALYLETMRVLFPEMTSKQTAKQIRANKAFYLTAFKDKGYYLIDATDTPIAGMSKSRKLSTLAHDRQASSGKGSWACYGGHTNCPYYYDCLENALCCTETIGL